jgi:hypothetical protein
LIPPHKFNPHISDLPTIFKKPSSSSALRPGYDSRPSSEFGRDEDFGRGFGGAVLRKKLLRELMATDEMGRVAPKGLSEVSYDTELGGRLSDSDRTREPSV